MEKVTLFQVTNLVTLLLFLKVGCHGDNCERFRNAPGMKFPAHKKDSLIYFRMNQRLQTIVPKLCRLHQNSLLESYLFYVIHIKLWTLLWILSDSFKLQKTALAFWRSNKEIGHNKTLVSISKRNHQIKLFFIPKQPTYQRFRKQLWKFLFSEVNVAFYTFFNFALPEMSK